MKFLVVLILILLGVSYASLISMFFHLASLTTANGETIFGDSDFFSAGPEFTLMGLTFNDKSQFRAMNFFFFLNSLLYYLNVSVINPIFSRIINNAVLRVSPKVASYLSLLLIVYDLWNAFRSFFTIIGVTSNLMFFISNTLGYLIGDIVIKNIYLMYPDLLKYEYIDEPDSTVSENQSLNHPPLFVKKGIVKKVLDFVFGGHQGTGNPRTSPY